MFNPDFNPYDELVHLQTTQNLQAENVLKISEWMMEISVVNTKQAKQLDSVFSLLTNMHQQMQILDERIKLLEKHLLASINNTSSEGPRI